AIAINTAKTGISPAQATIISNTSGINTGDQDISGIAVNATNIATNDTDIATNATNIAANDTDITANAADIAAHNTADGDLSDTNEIQTLSKTGNTYALSLGGGTANEAVTSIVQDTSTGEITYTNEATTDQTANVIASETNNDITVGANGGALFESMVKAIGKISSTGGILKATSGISASRISTGRYSVTLPAGMVSDANYIIQLTQPGRGGAGNDDPGISYSNQTSTGFEVIIGDNDNGGTNRSRYNSEFMFIVFDL
ncbi:MAG: hypothetical protein WBM77_13340, partial [Maribacter sp.]